MGARRTEEGDTMGYWTELVIRVGIPILIGLVIGYATLGRR